MADIILEANNPREAVYTATAGQTDFGVPFHYNSAAEMGVTVTTTAGVVTTPAFTMVPAGPAGSAEAPGILRLTAALAGTERVEVYGLTPLGRKVSMTESQGTPSTKLNTEFSNLEKQIQEVAQRVSRGLLARRGETLPGLPAKATLAGKLAWLNAAMTGWELLDASYLLALAADLAQGDASAVKKLADIIAAVEALGDLDVEIAALAAQLSALLSISGNLAALLLVAAAIDGGTIADLLDGQIGKVDTYAALTASSPADRQVTVTAGRTAAGDGGFMHWLYKAEATDDANGGTVLAPDAGPGRYFAIHRGRIFAELFGVKADDDPASAAANTAALNALGALTNVKILLPPGIIRHNGIVWTTGDKEVKGVKGATQLAYTGTTGDDWLIGNGTDEVRNLHLKGIDLWPVAAKSDGWGLRAKRLVRSSLAGVCTSRFDLWADDSFVSRAYGGFLIEGFDRVEMTDDCEHWGGETGLKCFGEALDVRGAGLIIDHSCNLSAAASENLWLAGGANVYFYGEASRGGRGIRVDMTSLALRNRELIIPAATIDGCHEEGIWVASDALATLHAPGLWLASCGQDAGAPAAKFEASTTTPVRINMMGGKITNNFGNAVEIDACAQANLNAEFSNNGSAAAGGIDIYLTAAAADAVNAAGAVFKETGNGTLGVCVKIAAGVDNFNFSGCTFNQPGTAAVDNAAGLGPTKRFDNCVGYVTRANGGVSTTVNGSGNVVIPHGMSVTPAWAEAAPVGNVDVSYAFVSADATNLTFACTNKATLTTYAPATAVDVKWNAEA